MPEIKDPVEFVQDDERLRAYLEWLANPMTEAVFSLAEAENIRQVQAAVPPAFAEAVSPMEKTALLYATAWGRSDSLTFMRNLHSFRQVTEELSRTYGADSILQQQYGYTEEDDAS